MGPPPRLLLLPLLPSTGGGGALAWPAASELVVEETACSTTCRLLYETCRQAGSRGQAGMGDSEEEEQVQALSEKARGFITIRPDR